MKFFKINTLAAAVTVAIAATAGSAFANEQAGFVKTTSGAAVIERNGEQIPAAVGAPVFVADVLTTGDDGAVGVTLRDSTILSLGANSELGLSEFSFDS
ncbi:MAG: hypothetical protein AAF684_02825, partial [Pseudomonadota bacterium]